jgi:hypothetical protein
VEGYSHGGPVTHNLYSLPGFALFFCNQLASARLVIRRALEMEIVQLVSCLWFIGLIGLDIELPKIKVLSRPNHVRSALPSSPLDTPRCPRGSQRSWEDSLVMSAVVDSSTTRSCEHVSTKSGVVRVKRAGDTGRHAHESSKWTNA